MSLYASERPSKWLSSNALRMILLWSHSPKKSYADCNGIENHHRASLALIQPSPSRRPPREMIELSRKARGDIVFGFAAAKSEMPTHLACGYDSELGRMLLGFS